MKMRGLALLSVLWCDDPVFREWLKLHFKNYVNMDVSTAEGAAMFIRRLCGIRSRRDLMFNGDAIATFNREIREPYMAWEQSQPLRPPQNKVAHANG
ncbi:MAG TPA: hypothetical protein VK974_04820 [Methylophilaceae bacterium]|nr:hypothetical protein [Methylophilaceae bacterium]